MAIPAPISALMQDTVGVRVFIGKDSNGDPSYATKVNVRARVTYKRGYVATAGGGQVVTTTMVYMEDLPGFRVDSEITLPDASVYLVDQFSRPAWPDGSRHLEVAL